MNTQDINNRIETSMEKFKTMVEKAECLYKEETTQAVHDFIESAKEYFPDGLTLSGYCDRFPYDRAKVWNNDGKRVRRTFIVEMGRPRSYIRKLQECPADNVSHVACIVGELGYKIAKFEEVNGGRMFVYHRLHFRGTHTSDEMGLEGLPQFVMDRMVDFCDWPFYAAIVPLGFGYYEIRDTWNYDDFQTAATAAGGSYDVFLCMETGKYYYPSKGKLCELNLKYLKENIDYWMGEYNKKNHIA